MIFSRIFRAVRHRGTTRQPCVNPLGFANPCWQGQNDQRGPSSRSTGAWVVGGCRRHGRTLFGRRGSADGDRLPRQGGSAGHRCHPEALQAANAEIFAKFGCEDQRSGTTIVVAHIVAGSVELFWAGDSRAYRIRNGALQLLTRDHSVVQQMVDAGALSPGAAARHPQSNVITRALGVEHKVTVDHVTLPVRPGDGILLCSDGVSRSLGDTLPTAPSIAALAQQLLDSALSRDGSDNASLIIIALP
jgi:serine/threonine protein phosphatase PrpC